MSYLMNLFNEAGDCSYQYDQYDGYVGRLDSYWMGRSGDYTTGHLDGFSNPLWGLSMDVDGVEFYQIRNSAVTVESKNTSAPVYGGLFDLTWNRWIGIWGPGTGETANDFRFTAQTYTGHDYCFAIASLNGAATDYKIQTHW